MPLLIHRQKLSKPPLILKVKFAEFIKENPVPPEMIISKTNIDQMFPLCALQHLVKNGKVYVDGRNWCSLNNGKEFFSDSIDGNSQKTFSNSKNTSDASTSFINNTFSLGNKELDKNLSDVSVDLTDRPISPEVPLNVPSRNRDEDAIDKQQLEFMKDGNAVAEPSTIRPDSIRRGEKRPDACYLSPKKFKRKSHLIRHH
ncbi:hypothetical protein AVEN_11431-1 [Araneus ventricosus]|uniref:Uncharacterized protein n=1 Tax=Araneus ventricosus TaxID=182803 RepID=A0A4Y2VL46_ARAVE|nr:hypothetical protein AVEN_11431-1 [Araneus ventricosus]